MIPTYGEIASPITGVISCQFQGSNELVPVGKNMQVRRPRSFEVTALRDVHACLLEVQYPLTFFRNILLHDDKFVCFVVDDPDHYGSFAAVISAQPRYKESFLSYMYSCLTGSRPGYIMTLGTLPAFRNKGLATKLIERTCEDLAKRFGCTSVELHCLESNYSARRLYKQCGFQEVSIIHNYYTFNNVPHNAVLLRKNLTELCPENEVMPLLPWVLHSTVDIAVNGWNYISSFFSTSSQRDAHNL